MTYAATRDRAADLISRKGQSVTITRRAAGAYAPATGTATITTSTQTGKGVILDFADGLRKIAGTNIPANDRLLYLSALNTDGEPLTAPKVDDTVTIGGADFAVTQVSELSPGGTDLLYTLTVRSAA